MVITGRVPLLLTLGLVPVVLRPAMGTVWSWLLLVALVTLVDWWLAIRPATLELRRAEVGSVRLGYAAQSRLTVVNPGPRTVRALVRDAWQPTAGASGNRHRVRLTAGDAATVSTDLLPRRRGVRLAA